MHSTSHSDHIIMSSTLVIFQSSNWVKYSTTACPVEWTPLNLWFLCKGHYSLRLKGQAPAQISSKEKGKTNKILLASEHSASRPDANYDSWHAWWISKDLPNLCSFVACVNIQVSLIGRLTSDPCAWIHWTIVTHISGHSYGPRGTLEAGADNDWQGDLN